MNTTNGTLSNNSFTSEFSTEVKGLKNGKNKTSQKNNKVGRKPMYLDENMIGPVNSSSNINAPMSIRKKPTNSSNNYFYSGITPEQERKGMKPHRLHPDVIATLPDWMPRNVEPDPISIKELCAIKLLWSNLLAREQARASELLLKQQ